MKTIKTALTRYFSYPDQREGIYDLIRVFACIGVLAAHCTPSDPGPINAFLFAVFCPSMPMFFVMSGALLLGGKEKPSDENLLPFYLRRFESVILPFLLYACYWGCWIDLGHSVIQIPTAEDLSTVIRLLPTVFYENLTSVRTGHFWFVYEIIGVYLVAPFLKKGLHACSTALLKKLFFVILTVMSITTYLPLAGINLYFTNYFAAFIIYFILGYILTRKEIERYYPGLAIIGGIAFLFMVFWKFYFPNMEIGGFYELAPHAFLYVTGLFSLCMLCKKKLTSSRKINWIFMHMAKYSFCVYIIHFAFIWHYQIQYPDYGKTATGIILVALAVYGKALLFAIVFDNLITFNLQRLFRLAMNGLQKLFNKRVREA